MTAAPERHRHPRGPYAALARGCRPRGCRAPARRVHGRRVRYHIGCEPGQINGRRWRAAACAWTAARRADR
ncbi:tryptophan biosynthesis modulator TrpM [Streptomyces abyssalis]|uniref:tryptophan biosynthesis modulator TrpM n=1 Tax=Streptomyces abyssalis TaxID=933944 RepID=UPI0009A075B4|nr:hypothetical protein [Streptomyces abyssalis]